MRPSEAMLDRLERVIETLQDNSVKMGQMLAVHDEKLDKQDRIDAVLFEKIESVHREVNRQSSEIKAGCERDIRKVDERLRTDRDENVDNCRSNFHHKFYSVSNWTESCWVYIDTFLSTKYNTEINIKFCDESG